MRIIAPLLLLAACGIGSNGLELQPPVATVRLQPGLISLHSGSAVQFTVITLDANGNPTTPRHPPIWSTPDPTHLRLDTAGRGVGLLPGDAEVDVSVDEVRGVAHVTVLPLPAATVSVPQPSGEIAAGDTAVLRVDVRDAQNAIVPDPVVRWSSSDTSILRLDSTGRMVALAVGVARVTATVDSVAGSADITVLVPIASITVTPDSLSLQYDDTARLAVVLRDASGTMLTGRSVTWSVTGDPAVAFLPGLLLNATSPGRATLTAAAGHVTGRGVVDVAPLVFSAITAGATHSCGLRSDGAAFCWGDGSRGELGRGDLASADRPRRVAGAVTFAQLSAGTFLTCGLTPAGAAYCWGNNEAGQTGGPGGLPCVNWQQTPASCIVTPTAVGGGLTFTSLTAGYLGACGLTAGGAAYCWGSGSVVGDSTMQSSATPVAVAGGHAFIDIARSSSDVCALAVDGTAYCWGRAPSAYPSATGFATLSGAGEFYCGLRTGALYCWGIILDSDNSGGYRLGVLMDGHQFTTIAVGGDYLSPGWPDHVCALTASGGAMCWGTNTSGQLGDGTLTEQFGTGSTSVAGGLTFTSLVAGGAHTCALATDGRAYCWGANDHGQLGVFVARALAPVKVTGQP